MLKHTIWNERYRPTKIEDFVSDKLFKEKINKFIETNDLPHIMLSGTPGSGKTTLAKLLVANLECDYLMINASDENGIDTIREKVKNFAAAASFKPLKIIILDEADYLTSAAQSALRNVVETFSKSTRFIFTCNYLERMTDALQSRCTIFQLKPPSEKEVSLFCYKILNEEKVEYNADAVDVIVNALYPDIRRIINALQNAVDNKDILCANEIYSANYVTDILKYLNKPDKNTWTNIRQVITDSNIRDFTEIYKAIYDKFFENAEIVIILAEYQYKASFVVDKEICFMASLAKIIDCINKNKLIKG